MTATHLVILNSIEDPVAPEFAPHRNWTARTYSA